MCVGALVADDPRVWAGVDVCMGAGIGVTDKVPGSIGPPFGSWTLIFILLLLKEDQRKCGNGLVPR